MEPTQELKEKVADANKGESITETLLAWAKLFTSIPCFKKGYTTIDAVGDVFFMSLDMTQSHEPIFEVWLLPTLQEDDERYIICKFELGDKASIEKPHPDDLVPELEGKGFYEFTGTWDEVATKMVELNNLVLSSVPECQLTISR
jgi:hypothetical protein